jgi:hypothetical protein
MSQASDAAVTQLLRLNGFTSDEEDAYRAGYDSAMYGANTANCHFRHFREKRLTKAWERGRDAGNHARKQAEASKRPPK